MLSYQYGCGCSFLRVGTSEKNIRMRTESPFLTVLLSLTARRAAGVGSKTPGKCAHFFYAVPCWVLAASLECGCGVKVFLRVVVDSNRLASGSLAITQVTLTVSPDRRQGADLA